MHRGLLNTSHTPKPVISKADLQVILDVITRHAQMEHTSREYAATINAIADGHAAAITVLKARIETFSINPAE